MKHTRRLIITIACATAAIFSTFSPLNGQVYDVLDQVASSREKAAGVEGPYRFDAAPLTPAPKGYVPFYISH